MKKENTNSRKARQAKIMAAVDLINGLRQGVCPCGYMGTITNGRCFKCGTFWDINPNPRLPTPAIPQDAGRLDLARLWWEAGVESAKIHLPNVTADKWEDILDADKAFMWDAAKHLLAALAAPVEPRAEPVNRFGVNTEYFRTELDRLRASLDNRPADELSRYLQVLANAAADIHNGKTSTPKEIQP
jgi:hypothetical protein